MKRKINSTSGVSPIVGCTVTSKSLAGVQGDGAPFIYNNYKIYKDAHGFIHALSLQTGDEFSVSPERYVEIIKERDTYFNVKISRELFDTYQGHQRMLYFFLLIGNATKWCGRLFPGQMSARRLSELTGVKDHNECLKLLNEIKVAHLGVMNEKGVLEFASIQKYRSKEDYIKIKLNKYDPLKKGVNNLRIAYSSRRIKNQMTKAAIKFGGATTVASQKETGKAASTTLSNKTLASWLNISIPTASRFKKNEITTFVFERDITTFGIPTKEAINAIRQSFNTGAVIVSKTGYVKHEGAHTVIYASKSSKPAAVETKKVISLPKTKYEMDSEKLKKQLDRAFKYEDRAGVEYFSQRLRNRRYADHKWKIVKRQREKIQMENECMLLNECLKAVI